MLLTQKSGLWRIRPTQKAKLWKIQLIRKAEPWKIWLTQKVGLRKNWLTRKTGLYRTRGARNKKKEKVLLQAKGQLHGGAQGVLPRHKKHILQNMRQRELAERKKYRKSGTIGLTVYGP
jgi:hypothetical protein